MSGPPTTYSICDLRPSNQFRGEQSHESLGAGVVGRRKIGTRQQRQDLPWWTFEQVWRIEHQVQNGEVLAQHGLKERLLRWKAPVDERL